MSDMIAGTFNGTGAALYLCLGFIPDWVRIWSAEDADGGVAYWSKHMRAAEMLEGWVKSTTNAPSLYTVGLGIQPYEGGDKLTSTEQTSVTYGEGVYLYKDPITDYRTYERDAVSADIDSWTLGSSTNKTGNFNDDVTGTYIGEGSQICIDGKWYVITALTAGQGVSANEVTLSRAAPTGDITCITGMYDYIPVPIGKETAAGIKLNATTVINVNDELNFFEAGRYNN